MRFSAPEPLNKAHLIQGFDCGKPPLNDFLSLHALDKQKAMLSRTYVVTGDERVVGYYTLAHITVLREESPKKLVRGMPSTIPAILMARFAVDRQAQGMGLGRALFLDALQRVHAVMQSGAAPVRLFVVDAKDLEAKAFYEHFEMVTTAPDSMRLFHLYKTIRLLFEEVAP